MKFPARPLPTLISAALRFIVSSLWRRYLGNVGDDFRIEHGARVIGASAISIGHSFSAGKNLWLASIQSYRDKRFQPRLTIGNRVNCGDEVHIACINSVTLADDILIGSRVHITDHSHGQYTNSRFLENDHAPIDRQLFSKGPVTIGRNVWICDGVVITASVTVGEGSVIGANSVVTRDVPPYSIVAGAPARVVRCIKT